MLAGLECADLSALWYAATGRRDAPSWVFVWPRQVAAYESGNNLPHSKLITFERFALLHSKLINHALKIVITASSL